MAVDVQSLLQPISDDRPCGVNLDGDDEDNPGPGTGTMDVLRIFGSKVRLDTRHERKPSAGTEIKWRELRALADQTLSKSKDFRALAYLASSVVRLEGLASLVSTIEVAAAWLSEFKDLVYPRLENEDGAIRSNALANFADPTAIVDAVRRTPLVFARQFGGCSLRDIELASEEARTETQTDAAGGQGSLTSAQITALFLQIPDEELQKLDTVLARGLAAIAAIVECMRAATDGRHVPNLGALSAVFERAAREVQLHTASRRPADAGGSAVDVEVGDHIGAGGGLPATGVVAAGAIRSRQDAIRVLEAVADFFRRNEPSSPVPLFAERTKRIITMDFLKVLAEIAPSGLDEARKAAGINDSA